MAKLDDEASDELQAWAEDEAFIRYHKPLERLTLTEREQVYKAAEKAAGYRGAVKQLMGPPPGDPSGYASYGTARPGEPGGMGLRPHNEQEIAGDSDDLQAEAERICEQVAPGHTLADLANNDPALLQRLMAMAEAAVNYRGAQGAPPAYDNWPGIPDDGE